MQQVDDYRIRQVLDTFTQAELDQFESLRDELTDADAMNEVVWRRMEREERGE